MNDMNNGHRRPDGTSDATVEAVGKFSEAFEAIEVARGHLYAFHRLTGSADLAVGEAAELLRQAGHNDWADNINQELIGRNVLDGRWTFQIVEEYDAGYYSAFVAYENKLREDLMNGRRHIYESEMKDERRTDGDPAHSRRPYPDPLPPH
ncbi:MAG: hypothetical protein ACRCTR_07980 [Actinomycetota bacterium]